jgi:hypothetical protein
MENTAGAVQSVNHLHGQYPVERSQEIDGRVWFFKILTVPSLLKEVQELLEEAALVHLSASTLDHAETWESLFKERNYITGPVLRPRQACQKADIVSVRCIRPRRLRGTMSNLDPTYRLASHQFRDLHRNNFKNLIL